ncbi:hypothetical protein [Nocardia sp. NPDC052112]|uniref:hypothetical protein n=1 Tax=Nocardia sp. NPDC052112 TaxID=3155646 RepID=UPI0034392239
MSRSQLHVSRISTHADRAATDAVSGLDRAVRPLVRGPGSVRMRPAVNEPSFFETDYQGMRSPHYRRFLRLIPARLVGLTWVTGAGGTEGVEAR